MLTFWVTGTILQYFKCTLTGFGLKTGLPTLLKMLYSIITTIQKPTASVLGLVEKLNEVGGKLIVAGDKKGPASYEAPSSEWRVTGLRGQALIIDI
jgi:hypothetical protein